MAELQRLLSLIGLDRVAGIAAASMVSRAASLGAAIGVVPQITADALAARLATREVQLIDVRGAAEWREGHIDGALHVPLGYLAARLAELPADRPLVVQCQAGGRLAIAASLLRRLGRPDVIDLVGGIEAWHAAHLPLRAA